MPLISGEFEVKMAAEPLAALTENSGIGRMTLDKRYTGPLDAVGKGEFLAYRSSVPTAAAYVAMEVVEGVLEGRKGSFALQHGGVMGGPYDGLRIIVVPDSGTGELEGLSGKIDIRRDGGKHFYDFDYTLGGA
ncbi:DUF3224 domain-containing protein [Massilia endophytica]|uniref:DUF3224 domain-containing protein n=1 Tax=Massilia endophytica TaxID=2899220 RepID=UPI001E33F60D|nr:DUF3224 domain-containing protein [Massilia endophytica]UGQ45596.1 DUF3224 domain-containing protein [Massilia endophytica]